MREWCGSAVEVLDQAQQKRNGRRRTTLSSWRRLAVCTLTLVLVAGVHVAWAPDACAAPAEFVEQRISLDGVEAYLTLEQRPAVYRATLRFVEEPPVARIQVDLRQLIHDFQNPVSCLDTTWSENVVVEDGQGLFTPTTVGDQAVLDLGHASTRILDRLEIHLSTPERVSVTLTAQITDEYGKAVEVRSPSRFVLGDTVFRQRLTRGYGLTATDGSSLQAIRSMHELRVEHTTLDPVTLYSVALTTSTSVRASADGSFVFELPIAPQMTFSISAGELSEAFALDDLVGPITVADIPPWDQIILVNQHGEERIYDDQSVHLSLPEGLTAQDIGKVEWYRNGIRLRFVGEDELGLTNDQMKTFDGNPLEHSPASAHTDHAIMGYEYSAQIYDVDGTLQVTRRTEIRSRVRFNGTYNFASLLGTWFNPITQGYRTWDWVRDYIAGIKEDGFDGIQIDVIVYTDGPNSNNVFPIYDPDTELISHWFLTPPDDVIAQMLEIIREVGMQSELRIQIHLTDEATQRTGGNRGAYVPSNPALWIRNNSPLFLNYASIAESAGADYFCPLVENDFLFYQRPDVIRQLLSAVDKVFSGRLVISESTHLFPHTTAFSYNSFYDYPGLIIGMNHWSIPLETQADQRFSVIRDSFLDFWTPLVGGYRRRFPDSTIIFSETGHYNYDGSLMILLEHFEHGLLAPHQRVRDDQEMADFWAAVFTASEQLGLDGISVWGYEMANPITRAPWSAIDESTSRRIIRAFLLDR